jgi:folate-dependent phosphoribosylglycinamide formyltransferase PurN
VYRIGWFSTGRGEGSRSLLRTIQESIEKGEVRAKIDFVFCNRERGQTNETDLFLDLVESCGIPLVCLSSKKFKSGMAVSPHPGWRPQFDRKVMELLSGFSPDLCVLAGYMLIVGEEMCRRYDMVNLHPAAPGGPAGTWREVIWELIQNGASETGAMMHLVTPELDKGPPLTYCTFPIRGKPFDRHWEAIEGLSVQGLMAGEGEDNDLFKLIRQEGVRREQPLIVATLKAFSEGRIRIEKGGVVDSDGRPVGSYSLNREIDNILATGFES